MPTPKEEQIDAPVAGVLDTKVWLHQIMSEVAQDAGHDIAWICERSSDRAHCDARAAVCWLALSLGWPSTLSLFPHATPSTAIASRLAPLFGLSREAVYSIMRKAQDWHRYDRKFRDRVEALRTRLTPNLPLAAPLKHSVARVYPTNNDSIPRAGTLSPIVPIP
ncbi:hypothetical protein [Geminisphaera colitermitum]|uniref:hypothetical protein n=1 Tax=Geminisphaera colitermitum TaxID=1148786 RepID=UPI0005BA34AD|nr:hypothetical protein [Geminisphaera colitermitum]